MNDADRGAKCSGSKAIAAGVLIIGFVECHIRAGAGDAPVCLSDDQSEGMRVFFQFCEIRTDFLICAAVDRIGSAVIPFVTAKVKVNGIGTALFCNADGFFIAVSGLQAAGSNADFTFHKKSLLSFSAANKLAVRLQYGFPLFFTKTDEDEILSDDEGALDEHAVRCE